MKRTAMAILLVAFLLPVASLNTGCSTWKQDKSEAVAYKTLSAVAATVDAALQAYADVYVAGKVDEATHLKILNAHNKYRVSMATAISAAQLNLNAPASDELLQLANDVVNLIAEVL
jgi:hypothetical protein